MAGTSPCQDRLRARICGKCLVLLDKIKGCCSFSGGCDSRGVHHHVGEMQPLGTERSQDLSHHGLLVKDCCYPTAPLPALGCPSLPQSTGLISIIMINSAHSFSLQIAPFLCAGLQCCPVLPPATVGVSKAAPSPCSPLLSGRRNTHKGMIWGDENTASLSGHK